MTRIELTFPAVQTLLPWQELICTCVDIVPMASVVEPEPPFLAGAGAALFGRSRSREKRGGSGSSSSSTAQAPATCDPMFKEKI